ncbi:radical SAM protein [bacterium]|nr:radical SAM protein [bacterium]
MKKLVCKSAFYNIEIDHLGNVYPCCPSYSNFRKIGNITLPEINSIEEIFYSPEAIELRKRILNNDYSLCDMKYCRQRELVEIEEENAFSTIPKYLNLAYDCECNIRCVYCRDEYYKNDEEKISYYNEQILPKLMPFLLKVEHLKLDGIGEALASKHTRTLIKMVAEKNDKVVFDLLTNGLVFNEANIESLGLKGRLGDVGISIHSLTRDTYEKIMRGSHFDTVIKNIKNASKLVKQGYIKRIILLVVISDMNYKEIPKFIDFAKKYGLSVSFSVYLKWGAKLDNDYEQHEVWNPKHKNYKDLKAVLKKTINKGYSKAWFSPALLKVADCSTQSYVVEKPSLWSKITKILKK